MSSSRSLGGYDWQLRVAGARPWASSGSIVGTKGLLPRAWVGRHNSCWVPWQMVLVTGVRLNRN